MFNVEAGKKAYLESAYQWAELEYERRVTQSSNPIFGGTWATVKQLGNKIWRPIKVLVSYALGVESHPENVAPTNVVLSQDIQDTTFAENMEKSRDYQRRYSELKAEGVGALLSGDFGGAFRRWRAAKHQIVQETKIVMPDDTQNWLIAGIGTIGSAALYFAARTAARGAANHIINGSPEVAENIGSLSSGASPTGAKAVVQSIQESNQR